MNTMITGAAVEAAHDAYWRTPDTRGEDRPAIRAALEAALPHLAAPEAGNPVSVRERERFEAWAKSERMNLSYALGMGDAFYSAETKAAWSAWQAAIAARQPAGGVEPHGWVISGPVGNPFFCPAKARSVMLSNTTPEAKEMGITVFPVYAAPPQQAAQVDLGQFRQAVKFWRSARLRATCHNIVIPEAENAPQEDVNEADRLLALIDSQRQIARAIDVERLKPIHAAMTEALARVAEAGSSVDAECACDLVPRESYMPHVRRAVYQLHKLGALINGQGNGNG